MVKLSVIIPIFNVEKRIEKCLSSVIDQEGTDYQIECILVNDCTPDQSMVRAQKIIEAYKGNGISFITIQHEENQGISEARNSGIHASTGDYIIFVDSDDYIPKGSFIYLVRYATQYPDVDVLESNAYDRKRTNPINPSSPYTLLLENKDKIYSRLINFQFSVYVWNKMIKRSVITKYDLYFEKGIIHEDILWSYKLFSTVNSVLYLPRVTYIYEYNPFSITNTTSEKIDFYIRSHLHICNKLFEMPPSIQDRKCNLFVEYHIFIYTFLLRAVEKTHQTPISKEVKNSINNTKKRMLSECINDYRILLTIFIIIMYKPFSFLFRMPSFRHYYLKIAKIIKIGAKMTDFLHKNWYVQ